MISKEDRPKAKKGQKLGICAKESSYECKGKVSKEIKGIDIPVNTRMIIKWNNHIVDTGKNSSGLHRRSSQP